MATLDIAPEIARVFDIETTLENLGGDCGLLREVLDFFMDLTPQQIDDLATIVAAGDVATVCLQAHGLKGGASNVGAVRIADTARELELLAKGGSLTGAAALVARLRDDFTELKATLPQLDWSIFS